MASTHDGDKVAAFDLPDSDDIYARYLETCKRLGVTPTPRDRAKALIQDWTDTLRAALERPRTLN